MRHVQTNNNLQNQLTKTDKRTNTSYRVHHFTYNLITHYLYGFMSTYAFWKSDYKRFIVNASTFCMRIKMDKLSSKLCI